MSTDLAYGARSYDGFAFGPSFEAEIERMLRPLIDTGVRISLFAFRIGGLDRRRTLALTRQAFTRMIGPTGPLRNGDAGVLYVGPRPTGANSDQKLERWMIDEVKLTIFRHAAFQDAISVDLLAIHRRLDEVACAGEIIDELAWSQTVCRRSVPLRLQLAVV